MQTLFICRKGGKEELSIKLRRRIFSSIKGDVKKAMKRNKQLEKKDAMRNCLDDEFARLFYFSLQLFYQVFVTISRILIIISFICIVHINYKRNICSIYVYMI